MRLLFDQVNPDHLLSKMDGRIKIIASLLVLVMILSYRGMLLPLIIFSAGIALCLSIGIRPKSLLIRFSEPFFIIGMIIILKVFFSGQRPFFTLTVFGLPIVAHYDGFMEGLRIGCRIMGAVTIVAVLGFITPFNQFMAALSWMRIPRGFIEVSLFAHRYIFMLFDDAMVIYNAQKNSLGYSTLRRGLSSFGILSGSLVLKAFESSQSTAVAMSQRGYDGRMPVLEHQPFRIREVVLSALFIALMGVIWKI